MQGSIEVVIPAHNAARFIRQTLVSVAEQTLLPASVTVVDDRSRDDTVAVVQACAAELADRIAIRVIPNVGPRGPSAGRNTGIRASEAAWIALLDADDVLAPDHHAELAGVAGAAEDIVLAFGDSQIFRESDDGARAILAASFFAISGVSALPAAPVAPGVFSPAAPGVFSPATPGVFSPATPGVFSLETETFPAMLRHGLFGTSACLFRRDTAIAAGLFDETMMFSEDTDFFLRMALMGRFAFTRAVTTYKRVHDANLTDPKNFLAFSRGTVISYQNLLRRTAPPVLDPQQRAVVDQALRRVVYAYLWNASREHWRGYVEAVMFLSRNGFLPAALNPRHFLRAVWAYAASRRHRPV